MRRADIGAEEPREGEACACGTVAEIICYTPVHNGVYATPVRVPLCGTCAYLLAEHIADFWGASAPSPRGGDR